ncbi:hypothetical protein FSP39_004390 [Pinctada imbricata]|uniref:Arrestin C-terminal-like domain-containing protein n=1 Tax=Pinctada imbricata TaxID=66713 RepID=A0AA88XPS0_PINIB|nr:hypothetical protein FSP39_004390 [Pinctada imbricata]
MGAYCFPFKVKLLSEIPGSFSCQGGTDASWVAKVTYWLKAELIGAEDVCTNQHLVVHHPLPSGILPNDPPLAVTSKIEMSHLLVFKKKVFVTAKLTKQVWQSGDVAKLRVIITNDTGVDVDSIKMKLFRELILMKRGITRETLDPRVTMDIDDNVVCMRPEGTEPYLVWESTIAGCSQEVLNKGVEEIWIPLKHSDGTPLLTSVCGYHIQVLQSLTYTCIDMYQSNEIFQVECLTQILDSPCEFH